MSGVFCYCFCLLFHFSGCCRLCFCQRSAQSVNLRSSQFFSEPFSGNAWSLSNFPIHEVAFECPSLEHLASKKKREKGKGKNDKGKGHWPEEEGLASVGVEETTMATFLFGLL